MRVERDPQWTEAPATPRWGLESQRSFLVEDRGAGTFEVHLGEHMDSPEERERREHLMVKMMMGLCIGMIALCAGVVWHLIKG